MPVSGRTRPFGAGPYGFAAFGSWRLDRAGGRALADSAAGGGVRRSRLGMAHAAAASATMGGALNPKASGGALAAGSEALGGIRRDGVPGAYAAAISDIRGGVARTLGGTGRVAAEGALRGRLRALWDRPADVPAAPVWSPNGPGGSGPWFPSPMPGAPLWVPQPPAER